MSRPKSDPMGLAGLLPQVLDELGLASASRVLRVADHWSAWVGAEIADHCRPLALRGDVIELGVESSVWSQQLQFRVPEILAALRRELGAEAPASVRFRVAGQVVESAP